MAVLAEDQGAGAVEGGPEGVQLALGRTIVVCLIADSHDSSPRAQDDRDLLGIERFVVFLLRSF